MVEPSAASPFASAAATARLIAQSGKVQWPAIMRTAGSSED